MKSNTPIEGMWSAMSVIQMTSYLTLINLNYPQNLISFLEYLEAVHNFNSFVPNPLAWIINQEKVTMTSYRPYFEDRGFANRQMLLLCGSDLVMLIFSGIAIIFLSVVSNYFQYFLRVI